MPSRARIVAYMLAGFPAAVGVWFVARFAYVTADTAIDGASSAFLFGMIAAGAYAGPAIALAVANNGRKGAAWLFWLLALAAMATNWTQTLGAVAHRGAGAEAERVKLAATVSQDRTRLARIERERAAMKFSATDAEAVKAAQATVLAAERTRLAECGNGDPKQRGPNCRLRETQESDARMAASTAVANKALTDQAAKLDNDAASISTRLAKAPAVKEGDALGAALGRLLPLSAATAATAQQGLISAIVELLIAAALALPELLRRERSAVPERRSDGETTPAAAKPGSVDRFLLACVGKAKGERVSWAKLYGRYRAWCTEHDTVPLSAERFGKRLEALRADGVLRARAEGDDVFCVDVVLVA